MERRFGFQGFSKVEEHFAEYSTTTDHVSYNRHHQRPSEVLYAPLVTQGMPKERFGRTTVFSSPPAVASGKTTREPFHKNDNQYIKQQLLHVHKQTRVPQASEEGVVLNCNDAAKLYGGVLYSSYQRGKLPGKTYY